jgi:TRAP-type C4-dicarboxylate transport system substrate-binding protein
MRRFAIALLAAGLVTPAGAQETVLKFGTLDGPTAHINAQVLHPWAKRVNDAAGGAVKIEVFDGSTLISRTNFYDRVLTDVVQIAWGLHTNVAGKFPRMDVVTIPFLTESAAVASVASWKLYKSGLVDAEYDQAVPLYVAGFPPTSLHMASPLRSLDDLGGAKLIAGGKVLAEAATRLGGTPITLTLGEAYQSIQRRVVDGVMIQFTAFQPFKLAEVTKYHVDVPLGSSSGMVFMAKARYQALPEAARRAIDAASGEAQSRAFGQFWDRVQEEGRAMVRAAADQTIVTLSPTQAESWRRRLAPIAEEWAASAPDGRKVLEAYKGFATEAVRN